MNTKVCNHCKKGLSIEEYHKDKRQEDGFSRYCRNCNSIFHKQHYLKYKEKIKNRTKKYYHTNKNKVKQYRLKSAKRIKLYQQKYDKIDYQKNKQKIIKQNTEYARKRCKWDVGFKITRYLRNRVYYALKGKNKSVSTMKLIGCNIDYLKQHLESQFKPGMSWSNYGKWHIDHKIPCASFDLSKPEEQRKCFHYTNLQPLWAEENLIKGKKF